MSILNFSFHYSHIYFFGDMNYRINPCNMNVRELASSGQFKALLEYEQLLQQKGIKRIFHKFHEGDIIFKPTFKYDVDSDEWDSRYVPNIYELLGPFDDDLLVELHFCDFYYVLLL